MNTTGTQNLTLLVASREVFRHFPYILLTAIMSTGFFVFAVWLPNLKLVIHTVIRGDIAVNTKMTLLVDLLGSIQTNFTVLSALATIVIAILLGINIAMVMYFIRKKGSNVNQRGFWVGIGGLGSGIVGVGCAACGSIVLGSILPVVGVAAVIALLPLRGREFDILSIGLLLISIGMLARKIVAPAVCKPLLLDP